MNVLSRVTNLTPQQNPSLTHILERAVIWIYSHSHHQLGFKMRHSLWLTLLISIQNNALASEQSDDFGRLFTTASERQHLDLMRQQQADKNPKASETEQHPAEKASIMQGIVKRSDGRTTLWMNHEFIQRDHQK